MKYLLPLLAFPLIACTTVGPPPAVPTLGKALTPVRAPAITLAPLLGARQVTTVTVVPRGGWAVAWDAPDTKADGSPLDDLAGYRAAVAPAAADMNAGGQPIVVTSRTNDTRVSGAALDPQLDSALEYGLWVQAENTAGQTSPWARSSANIRVSDPPNPPDSPTNIRIVIEVQVR